MSSIRETHLLKRGFHKCKDFMMIELPVQKKGKPKQLKIRNGHSCGRFSRWIKKTGNGKIILYYDKGVWLFPKYKKNTVFYGDFDKSYKTYVSTISELDIIVCQMEMYNKNK